MGSCASAQRRERAQDASVHASAWAGVVRARAAHRHDPHSACVKVILVDEKEAHIIYTGSWDGLAKRWDLRSATCELTYTGCSDDIIDMAQCTTPWGADLLFAVGGPPGVCCWDRRDGTLLAAYNVNEDAAIDFVAYAVAATPVAVICGHATEGILSWDLRETQLQPPEAADAAPGAQRSPAGSPKRGGERRALAGRGKEAEGETSLLGVAAHAVPNAANAAWTEAQRVVDESIRAACELVGIDLEARDRAAAAARRQQPTHNPSAQPEARDENGVRLIFEPMRFGFVGTMPTSRGTVAFVSCSGAMAMRVSQAEGMARQYLASAHTYEQPMLIQPTRTRLFRRLAYRARSTINYCLPPAISIPPERHYCAFLWDADSGICTAVLAWQHSAPLRAVEFWGSHSVFTGDLSGLIVQWRVPSGAPVRILRSKQGSIRDMTVLPRFRWELTLPVGGRKVSLFESPALIAGSSRGPALVAFPLREPEPEKDRGRQRRPSELAHSSASLGEVNRHLAVRGQQLASSASAAAYGWVELPYEGAAAAGLAAADSLFSLVVTGSRVVTGHIDGQLFEWSKRRFVRRIDDPAAAAQAAAARRAESEAEVGGLYLGGPRSPSRRFSLLARAPYTGEMVSPEPRAGPRPGFTAGSAAAADADAPPGHHVLHAAGAGGSGFSAGSRLSAGGGGAAGGGSRPSVGSSGGGGGGGGAHAPTVQDIARLTRNFEKWDSDNDGLVTRDEFLEGMRQIVQSSGAEVGGVPRELSVRDAERIFDALDTDSTGRIDLVTFKLISKKLQDRDLINTRLLSRRASSLMW